jgi:hypothetical protein
MRRSVRRWIIAGVNLSAILFFGLAAHSIPVRAEDPPVFKRGLWQTEERIEINGKTRRHISRRCSNPTNTFKSLFTIGVGICPATSVTKRGSDYLIKTACTGSIKATKDIVLTPQGDSAYTEVSNEPLVKGTSKVTIVAKRIGACG